MSSADSAEDSALRPAIIAVGNLLQQELTQFEERGWTEGLCAYAEIEVAPVAKKTVPFYRHLVPLRQRLVGLLATSYRQYFKLTLAHPNQTSSDPHAWACSQLQHVMNVAVEWIQRWYILACDGENESVRHVGSVDFVPGGTASVPIPATVPPLPRWQAPGWLFQISLALVGVGPLKQQNIPNTDSEEKLGEAHTRLLLKGARRVFLWELGSAFETARNEETAAAGGIRVEAMIGQKRRTIKRKGWEQRLKLYKAIQTILSANPALEAIEFCAELDRRHAQPLFDWAKSGEWRSGLTWKEAWGNPSLRPKIRRVRQEAQKTMLD